MSMFSGIASRVDGLINVLTQLGNPSRDKAQSSIFMESPDLTRCTIDGLYKDDGLAAKLVDRPADDLTREGFELGDIEVPDLARVNSEIESARVLEHVSDLYRYGSQYGGSLLVAAVDDGMSAAEPLDPRRIDRVREFLTFDRHEILPLWTNGRSSGLGDPDGYMIAVEGVEVDSMRGRVIHASRTQRFTGSVRLSRRQLQMRQGWGISVYQRMWTRLRSLLSAYGYGETILQDVSVDVFKIVGLRDALEKGKEDKVRKRLMALQMGKDILHAIALDAGKPNEYPPEEYVPQARSVAGIKELIELFIAAMVWASPMPRSIFLGETPGGLNTGTNAGETRAWHAWLKAEQRQRATPWVNWMLGLMFAAKQGPTSGVVPPTWCVEWRSLMAPTDQENADLAHKRALTDKLQWDMGAASADDVRHTRIVNGSHGDLEEAPEPEDLPDDENVGAPDDVPTSSDSPDDIDAPSGAGGAATDVQGQAMNGAQMDSIQTLADKIVDEQLPLEFGVEFLLVSCPGQIKTREQARQILKSLAGFKKKELVSKAPPGASRGAPPDLAPPPPPKPPAPAE